MSKLSYFVPERQGIVAQYLLTLPLKKKKHDLGEWLVGKSYWKKRVKFFILLLMEVILHHLRCIKPCKYWDIYHINWCRISAINSSSMKYRGISLGNPGSGNLSFAQNIDRPTTSPVIFWKSTLWYRYMTAMPLPHQPMHPKRFTGWFGKRNIIFKSGKGYVIVPRRVADK